MASRYITNNTTDYRVREVALMIDEIAWQQSSPPLCIEVAEKIVAYLKNTTPVDFATIAQNLAIHTEHAVDYYRVDV